MGRTTDKTGGLDNDMRLLWDAADLPQIERPPEKNFRSLQFPLWSENKAKLIQEYIRLFTYITKHGSYVDGFAAPQRREFVEYCSANLVLQAEPKRIRDFWLCDLDPKGVAILEELRDKFTEKNRRIDVVPGDFNATVHNILESGRIKETTATFALLDQRTFECHWSTVQALAQHKKKRKIELFYFLASGWIDRSIAAVKRSDTAEKIERWWGRSDWRALQGVSSNIRAKSVAERFTKELGYAYAYPYAIHNKRLGGRTMYHMIHATDHEEAPPLMIRAYRKVSGRDSQIADQQIDFMELWREVEAEEI